MNLLYIDTETTGTDPRKHDIWQISAVVEIDGKVEEVFDKKLRPWNTKNCEIGALEATGVKDVSFFNTLPEPGFSIVEIERILRRFVKKDAPKERKFHLVGYNIHFDREFLHEAWRKVRGFLWDYVSGYEFDIYAMAKMLRVTGRIPIDQELKLEPLCTFFGIDLAGNAHDALYDIVATRKLWLKIEQEFLK